MTCDLLEIIAYSPICTFPAAGPHFNPHSDIKQATKHQGPKNPCRSSSHCGQRSKTSSPSYCHRLTVSEQCLNSRSPWCGFPRTSKRQYKKRYTGFERVRIAIQYLYMVSTQESARKRQRTIDSTMLKHFQSKLHWRTLRT